MEPRPLAAGGIARRELVAHHRVVDLLAQIRLTDLRHVLGHRVDGEVLRRQRERELDIGLAEQSLHGLAAGDPHRETCSARQRHVELGEAPDRGALKNGEVLDDWRDLRDHLDGRGSRSDDRDALARQVQVVVPARRVHGQTRERIDAVDIGQFGCDEHPAGVDEEPGGDDAAGIGADVPQVLLLVEVGAEHLGLEPDLAAQTVLVDAVLGVGLQFVPGRVGARPVRALLEGELVRERRNVNGDTGIRVPVPSAAWPVASLDHQVVAQARLVELDGGADAGKTGADDDGVVVGHCLHLPVLLSSAGPSRRWAMTCNPCLGRNVSVASSST